MEKIIKRIIPIVVLAIFVAVMTSGSLLKRPFGRSDNVSEYALSLKKDVLNENWNQADTDLSKLKHAWYTVEKRVQFSVERNELTIIEICISHIDGAMLTHDKTAILMELSEIMEHFDELG